MPFLASLDHLVLTVADVQKTIDFYCGVLGCEEVTFCDNRKAIRFGDQNEVAPHALYPTPGSADLCFLSTVQVAALAGHFKAHGIAVELGPIERTGATGNLLSIYVRDPDGNLIEIANRKRPIF